MTFDELSGIWNSQNIQLEKSLQINRDLVRNVGLTKVKSRLGSIRWRVFIGIPMVILWSSFLLRFIFHNLFEPRFLLPAIVLLMLAIYNLAFEIYQFILFYTIDSKSSVIEAQKKLARLRTLEILDTYSLLVIIPLFSAPFLIVLAKAFPNIDLYEFDTNWLQLYTVGSVVIAVLIVFLLKAFPNKNLTDCISFLNDLKENENP